MVSHFTTHNGYVAVAKQLLADRCNVDLQDKDVFTTLLLSEEETCLVSLDMLLHSLSLSSNIFLCVL